MNLSELVARVVGDTVGGGGSHRSFLDGSLLMFSTELILAATILALLFVRLFNADRRLPGSSVALFGSVIGLLVSLLQFLELKNATDTVSREFFTGLLIYDDFTVFFRVFLMLFLVLVVYLTKLSGIPD